MLGLPLFEERLEGAYLEGSERAASREHDADSRSLRIYARSLSGKGEAEEEEGAKSLFRLKAEGGHGSHMGDPA